MNKYVEKNKNKILSIDPEAAVSAMEEFRDRGRIMDWYFKHQLDAEGMFPDTFGCESIFLEDMLEDELKSDFAMIAHEYLRHRPQALTEVERTAYASEDTDDTTICGSLQLILLNTMYSDARQGNAYARELFRTLYQTYYRREYQQLKRFRKISPGEALSIAGYDPDDREDESFIYSLARILTICPLLGIEVDPECAYLYNVLNRVHSRIEAGRDERFDSTAHDRDLYQECREQVDQWMDAIKTSWFQAEELKVYRESQEMLGFFLLDDAFSEDTASKNRYDYYGLRNDFVRILFVLRSNWRDREFTFEDVQRWSSLYECEQALTQSGDEVNEFLKVCLDGEKFDSFFHEPTGRFHPEKIRVPEKGKQKQNQLPDTMESTRSVSDADVAVRRNEVLLAELESLRSKVRQQKKEAEAEHHHIRELQRELEQARSDIKRFEDERAELIALREHVYRSTEEDIPATEEDLSVMENAIRQKRIVIIGGHDNWTKKLKNRFPDWVFFSPTVSGTWNDKILLGADYSFFFTDTISHSTYNKFLNVIRERKLPFGYIAEINLEKNIRQIYKEVCVD